MRCDAFCCASFVSDGWRVRIRVEVDAWWMLPMRRKTAVEIFYLVEIGEWKQNLSLTVLFNNNNTQWIITLGMYNIVSYQ